MRPLGFRYLPHISITTPVASALKTIFLELSRSSNGYFKPLLDPSGRFASETAAWRLKPQLRMITVSEVKQLQISVAYELVRP
jgi:hypothetical protein